MRCEATSPGVVRAGRANGCSTGAGVEVVAVPPVVEHAPGRLELHLDGRAVAEVDVSLCGVCRVGVIEHVRVEPTFRRRGFGRRVVAAALACGPGYRWSTTEVTGHQAQRFWDGIGFTSDHEAGVPGWCEHMRAAWQRMP